MTIVLEHLKGTPKTLITQNLIIHRNSQYYPKFLVSCKKKVQVLLLFQSMLFRQ